MFVDKDCAARCAMTDGIYMMRSLLVSRYVDTRVMIFSGRAIPYEFVLGWIMSS